MDYSSGIWGYSKSEEGDNIQNRATRTSPKVRHQVAMLRLWNKLSQMSEDCLTKNVFNWIIMFVKIGHMKLKKYLIPLICNRYISQNLHIT